MNLRTVGCAVAMLVAGTGAAQLQVATAVVPQVEHHQHLLSPTLATAWSEPVPAAIELPAELHAAAGVPQAIADTGRSGVGDRVNGAAQADHFRWSGTVAQGKTIDIRGVHGSIRTISSEGDGIHVDARRSDPAGVRIEAVEHEAGVTICAVYEGEQSECRPYGRATHVRNSDVRVDFVVRVPAGVRFIGSMTNGDIEVERLRSEVNVATIDGRVKIQTTGFAAQATTINGDVVLELRAGANADFYANSVSGTIDSEFPLRLNSGPFLPPAPPLLPGGRAVGAGLPPQIVRATIGNGGPELRVTTIRGTIRLQRR